MKTSIFLCLLLSTIAAFGGELRDACIREQTLDALLAIQRQQRDAILDAQLQVIWNRSKRDEWNRSSCLKDPLLFPCFQPCQNRYYFWK